MPGMEDAIQELAKLQVDLLNNHNMKQPSLKTVQSVLMEVLTRGLRVDDPALARDRHILVVGTLLLLRKQPAIACDIFEKGLYLLISQNLDPFPEIGYIFERITGRPAAGPEDVLRYRREPRRLFQLQMALINGPRPICETTLIDFALRNPLARKACVRRLISFAATESTLTLLSQAEIQLEPEETHKLAALVRKSPGRYRALVAALKTSLPELASPSEEQTKDAYNHFCGRKGAKIDKVAAISILRGLAKAVNEPGNFGDPQDILRLCRELIGHLGKKHLMAMSNLVVNIGNRFRPSPIAVELWSLALELEGAQDTPSPHLVDKLRRLILATEMCPSADFSALKTGIMLLKGTVHPEIAAAVGRLADPKLLVDQALEVLHGPELILKLLSGYSCTDHGRLNARHTAANRLMAAIESRDALCHVAYYRVTKQCWSLKELASLTSHTTESLYVLAVSDPDPGQVWKWCHQASSGDSLGNEFRDLIMLHGFYDLHEPEQTEAEHAIYMGDTAHALQLLRNASHQSQKSYRDLANNMDALVRLGQAMRMVGNASDATAAWRGALDIARRIPAPTRAACYATMLDNDLLEHEQLALTHSKFLFNWYARLLKPCTQLASANLAYDEAVKHLKADPVLAVLSDSALTLPGLSSSSAFPKFVSNASALHDTTNDLRHITAHSWAEKHQKARTLDASKFLLETMGISQGVEPLPTREECKFAFVHTSRPYHTGNLETNTFENKIPDGFVAVTLNVDASGNLTVCRVGSIAVTLPPSRVQSLHDGPTEIGIMDGITQLRELIQAAENEPVPPKEDKEGARKWWAAQREREALFEVLLHDMEKCWIGGFRGLLDPRDHAATLALDQFRTKLTTLLERHLRPTVNISVPFAALFVSMGSCDEDAWAIEDLLFCLLDGLRFRGSLIEYDMLDIDQIVVEIQQLIVGYAADVGHIPQKRLVLIPDPTCFEVPWESLPCLKRVPVARSLSLRQLCEQAISPKPTLRNSGDVFYVLNPGGDLPSTQEAFEAQFRLRGWGGVAGQVPTETQVTDALRKASCYIYVGHGAGKAYVRGSSVRHLPQACPAFLLGCGSAHLTYESMDTDACGALTDYAMARSPLIVGNLWNVKDKDFNRLCQELLSRAFDDGEDLCEALVEARNACVLRYLTGASLIVVGISS